MNSSVVPLEAQPKEKNKQMGQEPASKKAAKRETKKMRVGLRRPSALCPETTKREPKSR
jgi:hypothetical protein